jgi:hypothetical protein
MQKLQFVDINQESPKYRNLQKLQIRLKMPKPAKIADSGKTPETPSKRFESAKIADLHKTPEPAIQHVKTCKICRF